MKEIKGIKKNVCVVEQKIAYDFSFQYFQIGRNIFNQEISAEEKATEIKKIEKDMLQRLKKDCFSSYNKNEIVIAFRNGFESYCNSPFIASTYEEIGKCFFIFK